MIGLVLYSSNKHQQRQTFIDHLYSFDRYSVFRPLYFNVEKKLPQYLTLINFDYVILHYSFLANQRFLKDPVSWEKKTRLLKKIKGVKIALPQDEYVYTDRLCNLFNEVKLSVLATVHHNDHDIEKVYLSHLINRPRILNVLTGYIDDHTIDLYMGERLKNRRIDFGYRARKLPPNLGEFSQLKERISIFFKSYLKDKPFVIDINNTLLNNENTKFGMDWIEFLK